MNREVMEARTRLALGEASEARGQLLAALNVDWRSPAGMAYRRRLEACLGHLDALPRELERALVAFESERMSALEDAL
ncbi:hypothetical protein [Arthrobacter rhombi]|uniref:hypothetical protein n=1 Tax=Arthrobacter rhombi TaxID=71253 RepID=UPI000BB74D42|nr:hypothetical protein CIK75_13895 [Glutamicibacter sp. BW78]